VFVFGFVSHEFLVLDLWYEVYAAADARPHADAEIGR
jgi:hypothetical protein